MFRGLRDRYSVLSRAILRYSPSLMAVPRSLLRPSITTRAGSDSPGTSRSSKQNNRYSLVSEPLVGFVEPLHRPVHRFPLPATREARRRGLYYGTEDCLELVHHARRAGVQESDAGHGAIWVVGLVPLEEGDLPGRRHPRTSV